MKCILKSKWLYKINLETDRHRLKHGDWGIHTVSVDADGAVGFAVVAVDPRPRLRPPRIPVKAGIFLRLLLDSRLAATGTWDSSASSMTYSRSREEGQGIRRDETREGGLDLGRDGERPTCWQGRRAAAVREQAGSRLRDSWAVAAGGLVVLVLLYRYHHTREIESNGLTAEYSSRRETRRRLDSWSPGADRVSAPFGMIGDHVTLRVLG
jgi:hypothetical protein